MANLTFSLAHDPLEPMKRTSEIIESAALAAYKGGLGPSEIASQLGVHKDTVSNIVRRHADLPAATRDIQGEYIAAGFKYMWVESLDYFREHSAKGTLSPQDRKNLALTAAISVDKLAMVQGWPTSVVAHLHEFRHTLGSVAEKLHEVAKRVGIEPPTNPDRE